MANEAVELIAPTKIYTWKVASGTAITKGAIMKQSGDDMTASASATPFDVFAGIAVSDKSATDGATTMGLAQDGVYDLTMATGSTCAFGDLMIISGANTIARLKDHANQGTAGSVVYVSAMVVGMALETGSSAEVIAVDIGRRR